MPLINMIIIKSLALISDAQTKNIKITNRQQYTIKQRWKGIRLSP